MLPNRDSYDGDACPVSDDLLGAMYRASEHGLPALVASVSPDVRAMLALFCYRRTHLHPLALAIASSCSEQDLLQHGGRVGAVLFAQSRRNATARPAVASTGRKPITLSTRPLSAIVPLDETLDEAEEGAAGA